MTNEKENMNSFLEEVREYLIKFYEIIDSGVSVDNLYEMVKYDYDLYKRKVNAEKQLDMPIEEMIHRARRNLIMAHEIKENILEQARISFMPYESTGFENMTDSFLRNAERNRQYRMRSEKALKDFKETPLNLSVEKLYECAMSIYRDMYSDTLIETETMKNNIDEKKMALTLIRKGLTVKDFDDEFK